MEPNVAQQSANAISQKAITLPEFLASNDWLNAYVPTIIGAVGGAVIVTGAIIWSALKFMNLARQRKKELCRISAKYAEAHRNEQQLQQEVERIREVVIIKGILFAKHDPSPHYPLCPSCYADGKIIRMIRYTPEDKDPLTNVTFMQSVGDGKHNILKEPMPDLGFICIKCKVRFFLNSPEALAKLHEEVKATIAES